MAFSRSPLLLLLPALLVIFLSFSVSCASSRLHTTRIPGGRGENGLVTWRRFLAENSSSVELSNSSFILAAERTDRKDPLNGYKHYTGGWNISNNHYWAGKFHSSTSNTLDYVVGQANITVDNLRNFSESLAAAENISVDQVLLPADMRGKIDAIQTKLNSSANDLAAKTKDNSRKIQRVLDTVVLDLIIVAAVMLLLAFLGFLFSILGLQFLVSILVIVGWILVAGTFILCGVFLLLHNMVNVGYDSCLKVDPKTCGSLKNDVMRFCANLVVADTCVAMNDWVAHPHAHTALDDILPCVDSATANESLYRGREVTYQLVNVVNQVINNISNRDFPPSAKPLYYNQSGRLMPPLCNPYTANLSNRTCTAGEVSLNNASQVWKGYICQAAVVSGNEICTTTGRVTPSIYKQMAAAVSVSQGIYLYGPFLTDLEDCTFVRQTFTEIDNNHCPDLELHSKWIYIGLVMVSTAVMLSLIFWVIYARERRHRKYNKQFIRSGQPPLPLQDKAP
ncbi:putative Transmembrane protein [Cocos nucifera]|uniref:Putative Transmembrane protein n=1 Tax=Cocos nucifera TaxID=13894 RepID=A0A8K0HX62_COCNU|nr:putative Transmembrane protein [Cocos nucifera]